MPPGPLVRKLNEHNIVMVCLQTLFEKSTKSAALLRKDKIVHFGNEKENTKLHLILRIIILHLKKETICAGRLKQTKTFLA